MRRIVVRMASRGTGGQAKAVGEIDDTGASWGNGPGQLRGAAVQQFVALLGSGRMESRLDLVVGRQGLGGCAISKVSQMLEFTCAATFLANELSR